MALKCQENVLFLWLIPAWKTVHLQQVKEMQSSKQGMWKGYHLTIEDKRKEYLFCEKWYILLRIHHPPHDLGMNFIYKGIAVLRLIFHFKIKDWDFLLAGSHMWSNDYWILTQRESQRQKLSSAKYETFIKRLASVVYVNMQYFSFFRIMLVQKQYICF